MLQVLGSVLTEACRATRTGHIFVSTTLVGPSSHVLITVHYSAPAVAAAPEAEVFARRPSADATATGGGGIARLQSLASVDDLHVVSSPGITVPLATPSGHVGTASLPHHLAAEVALELTRGVPRESPVDVADGGGGGGGGGDDGDGRDMVVSDGTKHNAGSRVVPVFHMHSTMDAAIGANPYSPPAGAGNTGGGGRTRGGGGGASGDVAYVDVHRIGAAVSMHVCAQIAGTLGGCGAHGCDVM